MKRIMVLLAVLLLNAPQAFAEGQFVRSVVDGQTLQLLNGERLYLLGIDIREDKFEDAAQFVRSLVSGSVIALEYEGARSDEDGNLQAYVWFRYVPRMNNGQVIFPGNFDVHYVVDNEGEGDFFVLLNTTIVKAGYATPSTDLPNSKYSRLINKLYEERPIETVKAETEIHAKATVD